MHQIIKRSKRHPQSRLDMAAKPVLRNERLHSSTMPTICNIRKALNQVHHLKNITPILQSLPPTSTMVEKPLLKKLQEQSSRSRRYAGSQRQSSRLGNQCFVSRKNQKSNLSRRKSTLKSGLKCLIKSCWRSLGSEARLQLSHKISRWTPRLTSKLEEV